MTRREALEQIVWICGVGGGLIPLPFTPREAEISPVLWHIYGWNNGAYAYQVTVADIELSMPWNYYTQPLPTERCWAYCARPSREWEDWRELQVWMDKRYGWR